MHGMPDIFMRKVMIGKYCWMWVGMVDKNGYGLIKFERKTWRAHRLIWSRIYGEIENGMFICHRCDNPSCVNPDHLFKGTPKDNVDDKVAKGRQARGETHGFAINPNAASRGETHGTALLKQSDVDEIRFLYKKGKARVKSDYSLVGLSERFNISKSTIADIVKNRSWKSKQ